jgi:hypothetical protein
MVEQVVVGIDVSKAKLDVALLPGGEQFTVSNDRHGIGELLRRVSPLAPSRVVLEATGKLEQLAVSELAAAGLPVVVINPAQVRHYAKARGKWAKSPATSQCEPQVPIGSESPSALYHRAQLGSACPKRGAENPETKKFCGDCGAPLAAGSRAIPPTVTEVHGIGGDGSAISLAAEPGSGDIPEGERKRARTLYGRAHQSQNSTTSAWSVRVNVTELALDNLVTGDVPFVMS